MSTFRVGFSGDNHFYARHRFSECIRVHAAMVDEARARKLGAFVFCGDMYETTSTIEEREAVAEHLVAMAHVCQVFVVRGNHDRSEDLAIMRRLRSTHPIIVEEGAGVHRVGGAAIALMAWPERARLAAMFRDQSAAQLDLTAADMLRNVIRGLGQELAAHEGPRIAAGHFQTAGAVTSVGQPMIGQSMEVSLSDLALFGAPLVVMAHIHAPQHWEHAGSIMAYTGSPYRTAYGETEAKGFILAEYHGAELLGWERVPTSCAGMVLLEDEWGEHGWTHETVRHCLDIRGAEIRYCYRVPKDRQAEALAAAEALEALMMEQGAIAVKREPKVIPTTIARAPEVARALTVEDKLSALWDARGTSPDAERKARLLGKVGTLTAEVV